MGTKSLKNVLATALVLASLNATAFESNESSDALTAELNTTLNSMNQQKANIALESEVMTYDNEEYQAAEKQTVAEIEKLGQEIKDLERQQRTLTQGAERSRMKATLAAKRLALKKNQQAEAQMRMKKADNEKRKAEHQHSQVQAKVEMTEQQLAQAREKTREAQQKLRELQKDNSKLKSRIDQMKRKIAAEKRRKESLRSKRMKVSEEGQRLRSQMHKLQKSS